MFLQLLFEWPPFYAILLISLALTLVITIVYKYTTDQKRMRELKEKVKTYQEKMKKVRDDPEKLMKIQQEAMKYNFELMKHSLKPTLYTFLPIIIVFAWLNAHMMFYPLAPQQEFTLTMTTADNVAGEASLVLLPSQGIAVLDSQTKNVTAVPNQKYSQAAWKLKGDAGTYKATVSLGGQSVEKQFSISAVKGDYLPPLQTYKGSVAKVEVSNERIHPFGQYFSLFGWQPGWLATYIILSILLSIGIRKVLNVV
jgi:uncharacterized membrane protein (DUF106 family)